mmetsp:Transcript_31390/g.73598  ORF Transcript_31390/g.73598 Transcript_31390/m.73598 type:complete len:82 (+) Transcript_31390:60-305(+)
MVPHSAGPTMVLVSSSLRVLRAAPELEFPEPSSGSGWLTFEGISVSMLLVGLAYCALRAALTGLREVTCLDPPGYVQSKRE